MTLDVWVMSGLLKWLEKESLLSTFFLPLENKKGVDQGLFSIEACSRFKP